MMQLPQLTKDIICVILCTMRWYATNESFNITDSMLSGILEEFLYSNQYTSFRQSRGINNQLLYSLGVFPVTL